MKKELDIVVISDVHLGTYGCHAKELLQYLKSIRPKMLILNGDFIDIWQFNKRYFPKEHVQVLHRIMKMSIEGVQVYYLTGNHDEALRKFSSLSLGNIKLKDKLLLHLDGKKHWIFHGDVFDISINYTPLVAKLGAFGYDKLILLNRATNKIRSFFGYEKMSFTKKIKQTVKEAVKFISNFENTAITLGVEKGYDFVICGHIHQPIIREEIRNGKKIIYMNSGDWVEHLTALEYSYQQWSIYEYDETDFETTNPKLKVKEKHQSETTAFIPQAATLEVLNPFPFSTATTSEK